LRLYPNPDAPEAGIDVLPLGGRLVTFLSDGLPHEVLPARRERASITGWLKRRS
jgi:SM-20-related protein